MLSEAVKSWRATNLSAEGDGTLLKTSDLCRSVKNCVEGPGVAKRGRAGCAREDSDCFDGGFVLEQNGNPVPNWVNPLALVALQVLFAPQNQWLATDGADQDLQQLR